MADCHHQSRADRRCVVKVNCPKCDKSVRHQESEGHLHRCVRYDFNEFIAYCKGQGMDPLEVFTDFNGGSKRRYHRLKKAGVMFWAADEIASKALGVNPRAIWPEFGDEYADIEAQLEQTQEQVAA